MGLSLCFISSVKDDLYWILDKLTFFKINFIRRDLSEFWADFSLNILSFLKGCSDDYTTGSDPVESLVYPDLTNHVYTSPMPPTSTTVDPIFDGGDEEEGEDDDEDEDEEDQSSRRSLA